MVDTSKYLKIIIGDVNFVGQVYCGLDKNPDTVLSIIQILQAF